MGNVSEEEEKVGSFLLLFYSRFTSLPRCLGDVWERSTGVPSLYGEDMKKQEKKKSVVEFNPNKHRNQAAKRRTTLRKLEGIYKRLVWVRASEGREAILDATRREDLRQEGKIPAPRTFQEALEGGVKIAPSKFESSLPSPETVEEEKGIIKILISMIREKTGKKSKKKSSPPAPVQKKQEVSPSLPPVVVTVGTALKAPISGGSEVRSAPVENKWKKGKEDTRPLCTAVTKKGTTCSFHTDHPSGLCGIHSKTKVEGNQLEAVVRVGVVKKTVKQIEEERSKKVETVISTPSTPIPEAVPEVKNVEPSTLPEPKQMSPQESCSMEKKTESKQVNLPPLKELMQLPREERRKTLSEKWKVEVDQLYDHLLQKRQAKSLASSASSTKYELMYFGIHFLPNNEKTLVGPFEKKEDVGTRSIYEVQIDRHHENVSNYMGRLPYPLMLLGQKWILLQLPKESDEKDPEKCCLWIDNVPSNNEKLIHLFVSLISLKYGFFREMELPVPKGNKVSIAVIKDDLLPFDWKDTAHLKKMVGEEKFGQRLKDKLGVHLYQEEKLDKRTTCFVRSYEAWGEIPMERIKTLRLDQIPFPSEPIPEWKVGAKGLWMSPTRKTEEWVTLKIQQILWKNGFRKDTSIPRSLSDILSKYQREEEQKKKLEILLDGIIFLSRSFKEHSVERMWNTQDEFGIDERLIRECEKTRQMSFRGLLPGSGLLKGIAQVVDWLPAGYVLFHSTNDKTKEIKVDSNQPFRFFWDAFKGKKEARLNIQFILAHPFLFPDDVIEGWWNKMEKDHETQIKEKGYVDDLDDLLSSLYGSNDDDDNGLKKSQSTMFRKSICELAALGLDAREFPVLSTRAVDAVTQKWVDFRGGKLRITIPNSCHFQLISNISMMIINPEVEMVKNEENGIRFDATHKVAYKGNTGFINAMVNHGGGDQDDYVDYHFYRDGERVVVIGVRSPTAPSEFDVSVLEGDLPDHLIEGKATSIFGETFIQDSLTDIPPSVNSGIIAHWSKRACVLPKVKSAPLTKLPTKKGEEYGWKRYLRCIGSSGANAGALVNLATLTWTTPDWYLSTRPFKMEELIDNNTQGASAYGARELQRMQEIVTDWFVEWFYTCWNGKQRITEVTQFDLGHFYRKNVRGIFKRNGHKTTVNALTYGAKTTLPHFRFTRLMEKYHEKVIAFRKKLEDWCTQNFRELQEKKLLKFASPLPERENHRNYLELFKGFQAGHWTAWNKTTKKSEPVITVVSYLRESMLVNRMTPPDLPFTDETIFTHSKNEIFDNYYWKKETVKDGKEETENKTTLGFENMVRNVRGTGLKLISKKVHDHVKGEKCGEFLMTCLKNRLKTYLPPFEKPMIEDFMVQEENFDRIWVWLLLNYEEGKGKEVALPPAPPKETLIVKASIPNPAVEEEKVVMTPTKRASIPPVPEKRVYKFVWGNTSNPPSIIPIANTQELIEKCQSALKWKLSNPIHFVYVVNDQNEQKEIQELVNQICPNQVS